MLGVAKRGMIRQECWMVRDHDTATATIDAKRPPAKVAFEGLGEERGQAEKAVRVGDNPLSGDKA